MSETKSQTIIDYLQECQSTDSEEFFTISIPNTKVVKQSKQENKRIIEEEQQEVKDDIKDNIIEKKIKRDFTKQIQIIKEKFSSIEKWLNLIINDDSILKQAIEKVELKPNSGIVYHMEDDTNFITIKIKKSKKEEEIKFSNYLEIHI